MPVARNPLAPEFYVYRFEVRKIPFYVGVGRSTRASDRIRFVRYLMEREVRGLAVKWVCSNKVIREFLKQGEKVELVYVCAGLTREHALAKERDEIQRLLHGGFLLTNRVYNNDGTADVESIVRSVLSRSVERRPGSPTVATSD